MARNFHCYESGSEFESASSGKAASSRKTIPTEWIKKYPFVIQSVVIKCMLEAGTPLSTRKHVPSWSLGPDGGDQLVLLPDHCST